MENKQDFIKTTSHDDFLTERINVIGNNLLGSYNDNNEYIIADHIKKELIACPKVKKSVFQNSVFCGAFLSNYGELVFEVVFQKNTVKQAAKAQLFVLENEYKVNGYIQNTVCTEVAQYVDNLDNFIEKTYEYFHISISDNNGKEYNLKEDISLSAYIGAKQHFNQNMARLTQKDYNKLYREYVTKKLELLKQTNSPYTQAILENFNNEYAKIESYFLKNNNYKALSELLDKCVEDCTGINPEFAKQEKEYREKMTPIIEEVSKQADVIAEKAHPKAMDNLSSSDKDRMEEMERELKQSKEKTKELEKKQKIQEEKTKDILASATESKPQNKAQEQKKESKVFDDIKSYVSEDYGSKRESYDMDYSDNGTKETREQVIGINNNVGSVNNELETSKGSHSNDEQTKQNDASVWGTDVGMITKTKNRYSADVMTK